MSGERGFLLRPSLTSAPPPPLVRLCSIGCSSSAKSSSFPKFHPPLPQENSKKKYRVCLVTRFKKDEEKSSLTSRSFEFVEIGSEEKLDKPKPDHFRIWKEHWISAIQKIKNDILLVHFEAWTVPWTAETIVQVMLLWIASFWFVGSWMVPCLAHFAGLSKESLTHRGQALYSLLTDIVEGLAGMAILHHSLSPFRPLPPGWFHFNWHGKWRLDVISGCLLFPLVNLLSQISISIMQVLPAPPVGISGVEQSIVARDPIAMALYAAVVVVCAPVWEEIVFRGFLLPSLSKYMPIWNAVVVSAVAFALAHFSVQRFVPLVFLGVVMGAVFVKSRNLLAPMLLHSLWNGFVFLDLMK